MVTGGDGAKRSEHPEQDKKHNTSGPHDEQLPLTELTKYLFIWSFNIFVCFITGSLISLLLNISIYRTNMVSTLKKTSKQKAT